MENILHSVTCKHTLECFLLSKWVIFIFLLMTLPIYNSSNVTLFLCFRRKFLRFRFNDFHSVPFSHSLCSHSLDITWTAFISYLVPQNSFITTSHFQFIPFPLLNHIFIFIMIFKSFINIFSSHLLSPLHFTYSYPGFHSQSFQQWF